MLSNNEGKNTNVMSTNIAKPVKVAISAAANSHGSSTAATGGSGHEFQISTVYTEPRWGASSIPYGWCLRVNGQVVHFDWSYHECRVVAKHIEEDGAKAPF
jgi:hypothetical protein